MRVDGKKTPAEKLEYIKRQSPQSYRHISGLIDHMVKWLALQGTPPKERQPQDK